MMCDDWDQMFPEGWCQDVWRIHNTRGCLRNLMIFKGKKEPAHSSDDMWAYHGTSFSAAREICCRGLIAGSATDSKHTGVFFIGPQTTDGILPLPWGFELARARSKNARCTEWERVGAPSAWSMSVVVAWREVRSNVVACGYVDRARKWVIPFPPGTSVPRHGIRLMFDREEFDNWHYLHVLCEQPANFMCAERRCLYDQGGRPLVMCGGKAEDPFYWARGTFIGSSCGRVCATEELKTSGWMHAKSRSDKCGIWRCPHCNI